MHILNRLILILLLTIASGVSCRCGLGSLLEQTGCNQLSCGHHDEAVVDDCCAVEVIEKDFCCSDDPAEPAEDENHDDCLCCTAEPDLAVMGRDELITSASSPVTFIIPDADWSLAIDLWIAPPVNHWDLRGLGPPLKSATLLKLRTRLQV